MSEWKNHDTDFQAEIKRQREFLWNESILRIKNLAGKSIEVLDEGLQNNDFKIRLMCARTILALSGIAGATKETEKPIIFRDASRNFCSTCGQNKIKEIMSQFTL